MRVFKLACIWMLWTIVLSPATSAQKKSSSTPFYQEPYRPQFHFSPKEHWMNDPNGMVYSNGVYHLFYQYYPDSTVWGPMHWGHATSKDLFHWEHKPIALYPDSLGYIFSGSAVVDKKNTSGFGRNGQPPLVAIYTYHDPVGEKAGKIDYQTQGIAYSLDNGNTWTKYPGNPVLKNPGIIDFRDPKVMWHEAGKKWIMTLAVKDHIRFYSSPDLKNWNEESQFGKELGAHGGVWECPDLFSMDENGKKIWVLIVNINPGGPNGGSATQYFLGDFDGKTFTPSHKDTRWLDYGPDEYAGVLWNNVGNRRLFLGWMSNWLYATVVPTVKWRSAMTIPRDLKLMQVGNEIYLASVPSPEIKKIQVKPITYLNIQPAQPVLIRTKEGELDLLCRLDLSVEKLCDVSVVVSNDLGEKVIIGFDKSRNQFFIDRTQSGKVEFHKEFASRYFAPRFSTSQKMNLTLILDVSSVELFADDGLSVMTGIFFPTKPFHQIHLESSDGGTINKAEYFKLRGIWE